jgi:nucleotide-binding universal stress UspA family protein
VKIRRILVALDASARSRCALESALSLAGQVQAEIEALFVEDINLLRLAQMPFAREVEYPSGSGRQIDPASMERMMKARASEARRSLEEAAQKAHVSCSFRVVRGGIVTELLAAALEADLLVLGRTSGELIRRRLGSTARGVMARAGKSLLVVQPDAVPGAPVVVVYGEDEAADRALTAAAHLAQAGGGDLIVLMLAPDRESAGRLAESAGERLRERGFSGRFQSLVGAGPARLVKTVAAERAGALVLAGTSPILAQTSVQQLIQEVDCAVFLVR